MTEPLDIDALETAFLARLSPDADFDDIKALIAELRKTRAERDGSRYCRTCKNERDRRSYARGA